MSAKVSKRLVIDASVARASGGKDAIYPTSKNCRDFLQAVLEICHHLVMTPHIRNEWKNHESKFAKSWLAMVARKKLEYCPDFSASDELWKKIEGITANDKELEAMLKDFCLIAAALATDKTVISLDDKVRALFDRVAERVGELRNVVWVNPDKLEEQPIEWLRNGAEIESNRLLGNWCDRSP